jgi:hypothetical protein
MSRKASAEPDFTSIKIGPVRYPVTMMSQDYSDDCENLGEFDRLDGISLSPAQSNSEMASTLLHEVIHGCFRTYRLRKSRLTEERVCELLEGPLLAFIADNPAVVQALALAVNEDRRINLAEEAE